MLKKKGSSYLETLSPAKESDTVKEYDPAKSEGQIGKEHEEEVAAKDNWKDDKRDEVGRAASKKKRLATKLRRIARELEAMNMDEEYQEQIEDAVDQVEEEAKGKSPDEMKASIDDEFIVLEATTEDHPEQDTQGDPSSSMSAQTGDEDWIDIGPGTFSDKRDQIGRAANK